MKHTLDGITKRLYTAEEKVSKLEKVIPKMAKQNTNELCDLSWFNVQIIRSPTEEIDLGRGKQSENNSKT